LWEIFCEDDDDDIGNNGYSNAAIVIVMTATIKDDDDNADDGNDNDEVIMIITFSISGQTGLVPSNFVEEVSSSTYLQPVCCPCYSVIRVIFQFFCHLFLSISSSIF